MAWKTVVFGIFSPRLGDLNKFLPRVLFTIAKQLEGEDNHSSPCGAELKNVWNCMSACCRGTILCFVILYFMQCSIVICVVTKLQTSLRNRAEVFFSGKKSVISRAILSHCSRVSGTVCPSQHSPM